MINGIVPEKEKDQFSTSMKCISEHVALQEDKEVKFDSKSACSALVRPSCL